MQDWEGSYTSGGGLTPSNNGNAQMQPFGKRFSMGAQLSVLGVVVLVAGAFVAVIASQQSTENRTRAAEVTTFNSNKLINPGFELGTTSWGNWNNSSAVWGNVHSGYYSLRTGTGAGGRYQSVSIGSNTAGYILSGWGKVSAVGEKGFIGVNYWNSLGAQISKQTLTYTSTTYTSQQLALQVPAGTTRIEVWVWKDAGSGYFYADDISLVQSSTSTASSPTPMPTGVSANTTSPNLAFNRPAKASSMWLASIGYDPAKAFDGTTTTRWNAYSGLTTNQWLSVDLGTSKQYNRVVIKEVSYPRVTSYKLQYSNDGVNYFEIPGTAGTTLGLKTINFSAVTSRYVRLYMNSASAVPTIDEMEVYYVVTPTPTNTPTPTPTNVPLTPTSFPTLTPTPVFPTATYVPTMTPDPSATSITLSLALGGIGTNGNATPVHPQRTLSVDVYNAQNQLVTTKQGLVTYQPSSGKFVGNIDLGTTVVTGAYTVKVKADQYLRTLIPGIQNITQNQANVLPEGTMIAGDINGDNVINIMDYSVMMGCYSDLLPPTDCSGNNAFLSDLTDDGKTNQFDYNFFLRELSSKSGQ